VRRLVLARRLVAHTLPMPHAVQPARARLLKTAQCKTLLGLTLAVSAPHSHAQHFYYVEPGLATCPAAPAATSAAEPRVVKRGLPVAGSIQVGCGFDQGSYTVSLNSTDLNATFTPKTLVVNFGRFASKGAYTVTFSTPGVQAVSLSITSNMGSPAVRGSFVSTATEFKVAAP
jgi:hypothetical protein